MKWLIDLIINAIGIPPVFIDRGDPAVHDFLIGDFTADSAWHELDLSAIVPANAKAVTLFGLGKNAAVSKDFIVRRHGNANTIVVSGISTLVANINYYFDVTIAIDADRKIDYNATAGGWALLILSIKGWWL